MLLSMLCIASKCAGASVICNAVLEASECCCFSAELYFMEFSCTTMNSCEIVDVLTTVTYTTDDC